jgi:hypothetical protein
MFTRQLALSSICLIAKVALAGMLEGTVTEYVSGQAVASAEVKALAASGSGIIAETQTDSNGSFRLQTLGSGDRRIEVYKSGYVLMVIGVRIGEMEKAKPISVSLLRCGSISGSVSDQEGRSLSNAMVFAVPRFPDGALVRSSSLYSAGHHAHVDAEGGYRLYDLPPGDYILVATYGASRFAIGSSGAAETPTQAGSGVALFPSNSGPQLFSISSGEEYRNIDFTISSSPLFHVGGRLEGAPPNAKIWLALASRDEPTFAIAVSQGESDGTFHFDGIPSGSYDLLITGPINGRNVQGGLPSATPYFGRVPLEVGNDIDDIIAPIHETRSSSLFAHFDEPNPRNNVCGTSVQATLSPVEDWGTELDRVVRLTSGRVESIRNLAPDRYVAVVYDAINGCTGSTVIDLTHETRTAIAVDIVPGGSIDGNVSAGDGSVRQCQVTLVPKNAGYNHSPVQSIISGPESHFNIEPLPQGRYIVLVQFVREDARGRSAYAQSPTELTVRPGQVIRLKITSQGVEREGGHS